MALAKDGAELTNTALSAATISVAGVTSTGGSTLVVVKLTRDGGGGQTSSSQTCTATGLTFQKKVNQYWLASNNNSVETEIWIAWASSAITNLTITCSWTGSFPRNRMSVELWTGSQDYSTLVANTDFGTSSSNDANVASSDVKTTVTAKQNSSEITCCGAMLDTATMIADTGCTIVSQATLNLSSKSWTVQSTATVSAGNFTIGANTGGSTGNWGTSALEIIPASGGGGGTTTTGNLLLPGNLLAQFGQWLSGYMQ